MRTLIHWVSGRMGFSPLGWLRNTWRMRTWVRDLARDGGASQRARKPQRIGVVVAPWLDTSVPWFALAVGLLLAGRGHAVTVFVDDSPFGDSPRRFRFVLACLRHVMHRLPAGQAVVWLSAQPALGAAPPQAQGVLDTLAELNATWALRGEMVEAGRLTYTRSCAAQLAAAYQPIGAAVKASAFDFFFIPGGVYGTSGLWVHHVQAAGIRFGSFDAGGYGTVMAACDGIACQLRDIPAAFANLRQRCQADPAEMGLVIARAHEEIAKRQAGIDSFVSQVPGSGGGDARFDGAVLIALNSSWDAAALGLHTVYRSNTEWIVETVRHLLTHTNAPVVVRQHPAERLAIARTSDDYAELLQRHFGDHPRLHFIAAAETINSYQLLARVAAVVVYTSTIGTESVALGKPVVTASRSYYACLGFVDACHDRASYEDRLVAAARGELQVTQAMQSDALQCFYLTQCCNWVFSPFNPSDFSDWVVLGAAHLQRDTVVQRLLNSLQDNVPVATLNHLASLEQATPTSLPTIA